MITTAQELVDRLQELINENGDQPIKVMADAKNRVINNAWYDEGFKDIFIETRTT